MRGREGRVGMPRRLSLSIPQIYIHAKIPVAIDVSDIREGNIHIEDGEKGGKGGARGFERRDEVMK